MLRDGRGLAIQTTMSEYYRDTIRLLLIQELFRINQTQRTIGGLIECEHPDWGEPWTEAAHEAAINTIQNSIRTENKLSAEDILTIRQRYRNDMQISVTDIQPPSHKVNGISKAAKTLYLEPSAREVARQALEASLEASPEEVSLPDNDGASDYMPPELPMTYPESSSACKTITTRSLATLMRRLDRCPITLSGLEQLEALRQGVMSHLEKIDEAWRRHKAKLKVRARERVRRIKTSQCLERTRPGIARGLRSQLSFYTAAEDADDPFGQRDARCGSEDFALWDFSPVRDNVDWSR